MAIQVISKEHQAYGAFNGGQIVENKPIGFPQDGGEVRPYSNLFYWAYAEAKEESTIGLHPHQGFEIMSFVLNGTIRHYDTKLKEWRELEKGDAQIIRAGNGISHAEHMYKDAVMFQIWVDPNLDKTLQQEASYDDYKDGDFPLKTKNGLTIKSYVGTDAPLKMDTTGMTIEEWRLTESEITQVIEFHKIYSIYVLDGSLTINGKSAKKDDFIIIKNQEEIKVENGAAKLFVIASLEELDYITYAQRMQNQMRR